MYRASDTALIRHRLQLCEYGKPVAIPAQAQVDREAIVTASARWQDQLGLERPPLALEAGTLAIRAEGVAGFVQIGDLDLEIAPKFLHPDHGDTTWRSALWAILVSIGELPYLVAHTYARENPVSLADALGYSLLEALDAPVKRGLPRDYSERECWDASLRGRLRTEALADVVLRPGYVPVAFPEFTEDITTSRLIRTALAMLRLEVRSPKLYRRIGSMLPHFSGVSATPPSAEAIARIRLTRRDRDYLPAVELATLVVKRSLLEHGDGEHAARGFLWKSSTVFERYIENLARHAAKQLGARISAQATRSVAIEVVPGVDRPPSINTRPDLLVSLHGNRALLDAKYKVWGGTPKPADVNQVIVGGTLTAAKRVGLVYPAPPDTKPRCWRLQPQLWPETVWALPLDLLQTGAASGEIRLRDAMRSHLQLLLSGESIRTPT